MKEKKIKEQRAKPRSPASLIDALIGDEGMIGNEQQNEKQKRTKKETGSGSPTQLP